MQTIIVLLNPGMLENADLDLRYRIPDRIEEVSNSLIQSNGYDYIDTEDGEPGPLMGIWLETENAHKNWHIVRDLFQREKFIGNDLSLSAQIYISEKDTDDLENCVLVFTELKFQFVEQIPSSPQQTAEVRPTAILCAKSQTGSGAGRSSPVWTLTPRPSGANTGRTCVSRL